MKSGLSLMETICVLALFGVIAGTGTTIVFPTLVSKQRATVESSNLAHTLRLARSQAISTQQPIAVRFQRNGSQVISYTVSSLDGKQETQLLIENDVLVYTDAPNIIFKVGGTTNRDLTCKVLTDTRTVYVSVRAISGMVTLKSG